MSLQEQISPVAIDDLPLILPIVMHFVHCVAEKEAQITSLQQLLAEKETQITTLQDQLTERTERIKSLEEEHKLLKHRLEQNSQNSNNPSSNDRFIKPRSQRRHSGRSPGGQRGHKGHTLNQVPGSDVNEFKVHPAPDHCSDCGCDLKGAPTVDPQRCQVFDLPDIRLQVTEHQLEGKRCDQCGHLNRAQAPAGINQPTQYGPGVAALVVYLHVHQLIPFNRLGQLFMDLFNQPISSGTLTRMLETANQDLKPFEDTVNQQLQEEPVVNCDETGIRITKNTWLHVACTDRLTLFQVHAKRGKQALDEINVLPNFRGVAIHDCYSSYYQYKQCNHGLCNAHILRELQAISELTNQAWAQELKDFLIETHKKVEAAKSYDASALPKGTCKKTHEDYLALVAEGEKLNPIPDKDSSKGTGRVKKTKAQNLLRRLRVYENDVLRFVDDFRVPFTNNQAERDLRMAKVKQKVSGGFRTLEGASRFYRIRAYVLTAQKYGLRPVKALQNLFQGSPFMPSRSP